MMNNIPLKTLQRWMQSVIEHPGSDNDAWNSEQAIDALPFKDARNAVMPSKTLAPSERIAIYRRMFFLRMTESMQIDFPGVVRALGETEFNRLITEEYIRLYPSQSYTLNHLGRNFPTFLSRSDLPHKDFLTDLARLELSITENMDAEETPVLTRQEIVSVRSEEWETVVLKPIAALELLSFGYNVPEYLSAVNDGESLPPVEQTTSFCAVYRNDYRTYWEPLSEPQYVLLTSLIAGTTFGESIVQLAERFPAGQHSIQQDLQQWFNEWVSNGYFSSIQT